MKFILSSFGLEVSEKYAGLLQYIDGNPVWGT